MKELQKEKGKSSLHYIQLTEQLEGPIGALRVQKQPRDEG